MTFGAMIQRRNHDRPKTYRVDPEHLETLIDKLHQFLFIKDLNGHFIYANRNFAELLGVSCAELEGKTDGDFFDDELVQMFRDVDKQVQETGIDYDDEEVVPFPCGGPRVIWVNKTPLLDVEANEIAGVVGIFADVTRNRKEYRQYISRKTNELAHEILLPIQAISSNLENLIAHESDEQTMSKAEREWALKTSLSQIHVLGMAGENTQKALLGDAQKPFVFQRQSIRRVLDDCSDALDGFADQKGIELRPTKLCGDFNGFPRIEMSRPDLTRAFKNIYHNAIKYSYAAPGSQSNSPYSYRWVSTRIFAIASDKICVSIENYGIGILPDEIALILEEGYRGRLSIDRHRTGSGLGLSEVKKIVERHGGTISVESEKKGGPWVTTVNVTLPYFQDVDAIRYEEDLEGMLSQSNKPG